MSLLWAKLQKNEKDQVSQRDWWMSLFAVVGMIHVPLFSPTLCTELQPFFFFSLDADSFSRIGNNEARVVGRLPPPPKALSHVLTQTLPFPQRTPARCFFSTTDWSYQCTSPLVMCERRLRYHSTILEVHSEREDSEFLWLDKCSGKGKPVVNECLSRLMDSLFPWPGTLHR